MVSQWTISSSSHNFRPWVLCLIVILYYTDLVDRPLSVLSGLEAAAAITTTTAVTGSGHCSHRMQCLFSSRSLISFITTQRSGPNLSFDFVPSRTIKLSWSLSSGVGLVFSLVLEPKTSMCTTVCGLEHLHLLLSI